MKKWLITIILYVLAFISGFVSANLFAGSDTIRGTFFMIVAIILTILALAASVVCLWTHEFEKLGRRR